MGCCVALKKEPLCTEGGWGAQPRRRRRRSAAGPESACVLALGPTASQPVSLHFTEEPALRSCAAGRLEQKQPEGPLAKTNLGRLPSHRFQ